MKSDILMDMLFCNQCADSISCCHFCRYVLSIQEVGGCSEEQKKGRERFGEVSVYFYEYNSLTTVSLIT